MTISSNIVSKSIVEIYVDPHFLYKLVNYTPQERREFVEHVTLPNLINELKEEHRIFYKLVNGDPCCYYISYHITDGLCFFNVTKQDVLQPNLNLFKKRSTITKRWVLI